MTSDSNGLSLSLSASLLFEAAWIELQPEMISILLSHHDFSSMDPHPHTSPVS